MVGNERGVSQFIVWIEADFTVRKKVKEKIRHGPGVQLACVKRHGTWKVRRSHNDDAISYHLLVRLGESAVSSLSRSEIDNDRARSHGPNHRFGKEDRGMSASDKSRCDNDIGPRHMLKHHCLLLLVKLRRLSSGIATLFFRVFRIEG